MNNNTDMAAKKEMAQESITSDILAFRGIRGPTTSRIRSNRSLRQM